MTEAEWLGCANAGPMLGFLRGKVSERKLLLFAVAAWRHNYEQYLPANLTETSADPGRNAMEVAERYADGLASAEEIEAAARKADDWGEQFLDAVFGFTETYGAFKTAAWLLRRQSASDAAGGVAWSSGPAEVGRAQANLLRDIFGNPFRPVAVDPVWQAPSVEALAEAAYDQRILPSGELDPARLSILADALEEAACTDADILDHLRGPGPHVRGCWPIDLLLAKE
jgi:hypothetical protein